MSHPIMKKLWVLVALICTLPAQAGGRRQMNALVGDRTDCLLDHSVQYYHLGHNVNKPAIFADYYFMEALYRYSSLHMGRHRQKR